MSKDRQMSGQFFTAVAAELGPDSVDTSDPTLAQYGFNRLPGGDQLPAGVAFPKSVEDVQTLVRLANEHGATLWPTSTGHNIGLGEFSPVRASQVVVDLGRRMNRVREVNETLGYAVIEPGVTFETLRAELAARGDKLMISSTSGPPDGGVLGNALDRGAGYTPYFDHFGMICGMEIVLPDSTILRTGDGALSGSKMASLNKSGFGPLMDGLFSQSNFGIVTSATIWLMPRPPVIRGWAFSFKEDADLEQAIELIRPLKMNNFVPTLVKVTNDVYAFGTHTTYPGYQAGESRTLPDEARRALRTQHGVGAWTVSGAFYGPSEEVIQPSLERVKAHFAAAGATYVPHDEIVASPILKIHLDTFSGEPTTSELGLLDWRPGGGATWFLPAAPMIGAVAQEQQEVSRRILTEYGFEYIVEFVCGPRAARALHIIVFNRADEAERKRMHECYGALIDAYDKLGYPIGRTPTDFQESAAARLPELQRITHSIKAALDPSGVIAPGKYGIV